jgi:hypothetical protein
VILITLATALGVLGMRELLIVGIKRLQKKSNEITPYIFMYRRNDGRKYDRMRSKYTRLEKQMLERSPPTYIAPEPPDARGIGPLPLKV